jgi:hypothetical protein
LARLPKSPGQFFFIRTCGRAPIYRSPNARWRVVKEFPGPVKFFEFSSKEVLDGAT